MTRLRIGCVGTGFIAGRHLAALSAIPNVDVVAVADPAKVRAKVVAERFGARVYDDGVGLIDSQDLDAIWLCLPPFARGPVEQAALARDLPFFVEKPLALDLADSRLVAAAFGDRGFPPPSGTTGATSTSSSRRGACCRTRRRNSSPAGGSTRPRRRRGGRERGFLRRATDRADDPPVRPRPDAGRRSRQSPPWNRGSPREWPDADVPTASTPC